MYDVHVYIELNSQCRQRISSEISNEISSEISSEIFKQTNSH